MKLCKIPCENLVMSVSYDFDWYYSSHGSTESQQSKFVYGGQSPFPPILNVTGELENCVIKVNYSLKKNPYSLFIQNLFNVDFFLFL